jgi:hypothetical protein
MKKKSNIKKIADLLPEEYELSPTELWEIEREEALKKGKRFAHGKWKNIEEALIRKGKVFDRNKRKWITYDEYICAYPDEARKMGATEKDYPCLKEESTEQTEPVEFSEEAFESLEPRKTTEAPKRKTQAAAKRRMKKSLLLFAVLRSLKS